MALKIKSWEPTAFLFWVDEILIFKFFFYLKIIFNFKISKYLKIKKLKLNFFLKKKTFETPFFFFFVYAFFYFMKI